MSLLETVDLAILSSLFPSWPLLTQLSPHNVGYPVDGIEVKVSGSSAVIHGFESCVSHTSQLEIDNVLAAPQMPGMMTVTGWPGVNVLGVALKTESLLQHSQWLQHVKLCKQVQPLDTVFLLLHLYNVECLMG